MFRMTWTTFVTGVKNGKINHIISNTSQWIAMIEPCYFSGLCTGFLYLGFTLSEVLVPLAEGGSKIYIKKISPTSMITYEPHTTTGSSHQL